MLERLRLTGFKSFVDQELQLAPFTVLVGANASGKSNLFDALRFLQGVALGYSFGEVFNGRHQGGRQIWPGVRGGAALAAYDGGASFGLKATWSNPAITYTVGNTVSDPYFVGLSHERLHTPSEGLLFHSTGGWDEHTPAQVSIKTPTGMALFEHPPYLPILSHLPTESAAPTVLTTDNLVVHALTQTVFLDITPSRMRSYVPRQSTELGLQGDNLSGILWGLCQDERVRADLVDWLTELCAPELEGIAFAETELGDVMVVLVERGGRRVPARSLSDGTLRFLGILLALRTAPPGSLLLIEELESGLHPTRVHLLVEAIEAATVERQLQVLATTHSPRVLQALSAQALQAATLVARPPNAAGSVLRRLQDLPDFNAVLQRRGVDRLMLSGWLERAL